MRSHSSWLVPLFFTFWIVTFAVFWSKALYFDDAGRLVAGHVNIWGDWAAHMTMGNAMAVRGPFLESSPLLIGQPFAYPFVSNMLSGILMQLGLPMISSFVVPSFLFSVAVVISLYFFYKSVFNKQSLAVLAATIFLLNGGVGFYFYAQDILQSERPIHTMVNPPRQYTRIDQEAMKWISVIDSMVIPQRAFGLGFPLALLGLTLINKSRKSTEEKRLALILSSGVLFGLMPILHTHSFLAVFVILAFWAAADVASYVVQFDSKEYKLQSFWNQIKYWVLLALVTSLFALPLLFTFIFSNIGESFIKLYPGWLAKEFEVNWFVFWFKNWWLTPLLACAGLFIVWKNKATSLFKKAQWLPYFFLFVIANIWTFQPYVWDNTKLLVWTSLGFSGLSAWWLHTSWNKLQKNTASLKLVKKVVLSLVFISITLSGSIDLYYIIRHDLHSHVMFNSEEVQLAEWAKANTDKNSIWLTGDQHNHWLFVLTGRQALMTYRGWMWTHGYTYRPVEADVSRMFRQPIQYRDLFEKYAVDYVVVGPNEKRVWQANIEELNSAFSIRHQTQNFVIFEVD